MWIMDKSGSIGKWHVFQVTDFTIDRSVIRFVGESIQKDGWVVDAVVDGIVGGLQRGAFFVFLGKVGRNALHGYLYRDHAPHIGAFEDIGPGGGSGNMRSIALPDPAAGSDYADIVVPTGAMWKLHGFAGQLVTDANTANRYFSIDITDGTNVTGGLGVGVEQAASQTINYRGSIGITNTFDDALNPVSNGQRMSIALPQQLLPEASVISPTTVNLLAGDNWGVGRLLVEEWLVISL
jgi:hypothetical protein